MNDMNVCKFNPIQSGDLNCSTFVYEQSNCQSEVKRSDKYALHLVSDGKGNFECNGDLYDIEPGTIFIIEKNDLFSVFGDGLKYFYILFDGRRAKELISRIEPDRKSRIYRGHDELIPFWESCLSSPPL